MKKCGASLVEMQNPSRVHVDTNKAPEYLEVARFLSANIYKYKGA